MSVSLNLTYDATVDVAYLTLRTTGPADVLGPTLLLENDRAFAGAVAMGFGLLDGRAVGFEFQMASACLPVELLAQAERSDGRCSTGSRVDISIRRPSHARFHSGRARKNVRVPEAEALWELSEVLRAALQYVLSRHPAQPPPGVRRASASLVDCWDGVELAPTTRQHDHSSQRFSARQGSLGPHEKEFFHVHHPD